MRVLCNMRAIIRVAASNERKGKKATMTRRSAVGQSPRTSFAGLSSAILREQSVGRLWSNGERFHEIPFGHSFHERPTGRAHGPNPDGPLSSKLVAGFLHAHPYVFLAIILVLVRGTRNVSFQPAAICDWPSGLLASVLTRSRRWRRP